jgi:hypothetical protein
MKTCPVCLNTKSYYDFHFNHTCRDGHQSMCKVCQIAYCKWYREQKKAGKPTGRKQYEKHFWIRREHHNLPPDPDKMIKIEHGPVKVVFD